MRLYSERSAMESYAWLYTIASANAHITFIYE